MRVEPLVPLERPKPKGGRPRMGDREAFEAIAYVLRTGIQWNALPRELGASSTVHERFQEWVREGFFERLWRAGLTEYDELVVIDWEWQSADGAMGKAPLVPKGGTGAAAGPNPTDRGKRGTKRSLLVDGNGVPLAVAVAGANRNDCKLLAATLGDAAVARPDPGQVKQHLCLDKGYDHAFVRREAEARGYQHHIRRRGEERAEPHPDGKARRWVVERTFSWLGHSRRLAKEYERSPHSSAAVIYAASIRLCARRLARS